VRFPQSLLLDLEGLAQERLGAGVVAHVLVEHRQVAQARGIVGVLFPSAFFRISAAWRKSGSARA